MEFKRTSSPHVPVKKAPSNLSITRQTSGGSTPAKKDSKTTRLKRISSISNPKHIRSSRIKRREPNPSKFFSLENIVETALRQGILVGGDKLLLSDEDNNELEVSISILQHHLEQIEQFKNEYTHQLKIHVGASNLDQAYGGQKVRKKSKALLKTNLKKLNENLLDLEDQMFDSMGYLQITFKGLLDIPRIINNDCYEVCFDLSEQKWKSKGMIKNKVQKWQDEHLMMTILGDDTLMDVQALQIRRFLGNVHLGSAKFNAYDLISLHPQNVLVVLKGPTHVKLNLEVKWRFGYDDPDYGRIMDFTMHDVIIGSAKQECVSKRAKQLSIQRAKRGKFRISPEIKVDMAHSASTQDNDLLELELSSLHESKRSMPEISSREDEFTQSTTSEVADLTENFNRQNSVRNVCSVLHRSPSQFKRGQVGYKPILIESDSARNELMSNLQLDTGSNIDSSSVGSVCHLLEAYENLWVCLEDKKELCDHGVLTELEARLNKLSVLTRNKGMKHERTPSLTASETDALDAFGFLNESKSIFRDVLKADLKVSSDSGINLTGRRDSLSESINSGTDEYKPSTHTLLLDDYSSDEEELNFILQEMVDMSTVALERGEIDTELEVFSNTPSPNRVPSLSSRGDSLPADDGSIDDLSVLTTGLSNLDILLTTHLVYCEGLLRNIKPPGPLQFKTNKSLNLLQRQVIVLDTILESIDKEEVKSIDLVPGLHKCRELLLLWKACCGEKDFVAPLDNFSLALDTMFGEVWKNYPDVAHFVFPTIANQITTTTFDNGEHPDVHSLTVFQFYDHFKSKLISGLEEYVSEVAEDLSLYGGLTSEERYVVNVTLKRMAGMGYNLGILHAIPQMLLKPNESYQIADNYLKNITRDNRILDEVKCSYE
eukprot:TRINITY_DN4293_c0_g1_i2.p1 TRINITY_DN4293_c0_g1~~TRINITY_DN4293_c0_g1_i2.p1  ORF type:complete len:886 (-),score=201.79 TRINITY_DN4293_c0_g1_i2:260-2917(-)